MAGSLGQLPPVIEQVRLQGGCAAKEVRLVEEAMDELAAIGKVYDQAIAIWLIACGNRQAVLRIERWMCEEHHMPGISAGLPVPVESARRQETTASVIRRLEEAYYLFADNRNVRPLADLEPMAAAMFMIEHAGVATVPGDNFYAAGELAYTYSSRSPENPDYLWLDPSSRAASRRSFWASAGRSTAAA